VEEVEAEAAVLASTDAEEEARLAEVGRKEAARQRAANGVPGVGVLDTGVSWTTCSWAPSTAQLRPRGETTIEAQRRRPS
jgi:hypothetical protein